MDSFGTASELQVGDRTYAMYRLKRVAAARVCRRAPAVFPSHPARKSFAKRERFLRDQG